MKHKYITLEHLKSKCSRTLCASRCVFLLLCAVRFEECDPRPVFGARTEAAAGSHQTLWMTAVTRPPGPPAGEPGEDAVFFGLFFEF